MNSGNVRYFGMAAGVAAGRGEIFKVFWSYLFFKKGKREVDFKFS